MAALGLLNVFLSGTKSKNNLEIKKREEIHDGGSV